MISPRLGCVSAGGRSELTVLLKPQTVEKMDFDLSVKFRAGNTITTIVGASVEPPLVTLDKVRDLKSVLCIELSITVSAKSV